MLVVMFLDEPQYILNLFIQVLFKTLLIQLFDLVSGRKGGLFILI